jgi:hypothetical protein
MPNWQSRRNKWLRRHRLPFSGRKKAGQEFLPGLQ